MKERLADILRRHGASASQPPADWAGFLRSVGEACEAAEQARRDVERSMEVMSRELSLHHDQLRADIRQRESVEAALRESEARLRQEIADRERMEVELRLKQKLESVGQLAAGIAHEINTPVQYVGDSVHFIRSAYDDLRGLLERYRTRCRQWAAADGAMMAEMSEADDAADLGYLDQQVPKAFDRVFEGTARVASIVGAVKEFAHPDQRSMAAADLNRAIQSTVIVARNEYKYVADVETELGDLPPVECHIGDLNQVFLNLLVNAAHAIGERAKASGGGRGRIRVVTVVDGDDVVVSISDDGCGIPETVRPRVFDPFFTTKEVGRGTGQGLAICRAIVVEKHGGSITFETAVGKGTTFSVRLPIEHKARKDRAA